jgi:NADH-quinone oxidoreductase subunit M
MSLPILLTVFAIPTISIPFVYFTGKKSPKAAALFVALIALINIGLVLSIVPTILDSAKHVYTESYTWIPTLNNTSFSLFLDGISASVALISLVLIFVAALYSVNYMSGKKNLPSYYALLCMLSVGLIGVFITSNLLLFYFCWELMLVPAYFIVGEWGYRNSYKSAFKLFIFTHAGAVFVLLGIGAIYYLTGTTDMFAAQTALATAAPDIIKWVLIALTAGFAVKMAVFPVHMWLPDAHSEAPAPMSALLSGVIISAGAYAILRLSFGIVFPSVGSAFGTNFLYALSIIGVITAFFGSFLALVATDIKRLIAYSSIAHMGYIMFGLSLFPVALADNNPVLLTSATAIAVVGTVLHIVTHAASKGLFFLTAGGIMHQTEERDIRKMGGLAGKMPFSTVSGTIAALSIAGAPPLACFISEFLIFVGAIQIINLTGGLSSFYIIPTALMLIATVFSLAYALRFISKVFLGQSMDKHNAEESDEITTEPEHEKHRIVDVPNYMKVSLAILVVLVVLIGIYPTFFMNLIQTVRFG